MGLFWELYQQGNIMRAHQESEKARDKSKLNRIQAAREMALLEDKVDRLALKCQALWELVKKEMNLSDSQIAEKIGEIDMRDGVVDGKMTRFKICTKCGKELGKNHFQCRDCGQMINGAEIFDT